MPSQIQDLAVPDVQPVIVSLEPALNALHSLCRLMDAHIMPGLSDWVTHTAAALTPEERKTNKLVFIGFYSAILPEQSWSSFPAYLDALATCDAVILRDKLLKAYAKYSVLHGKRRQEVDDETSPIDVDVAAVLESVDTYLDFLRECFDADAIDESLETEAYLYIVDPPAMQEVIVSHLRAMWDRFLAPEWQRVEPLLQDAVMAFQQVDFSGMNRLEAAQLITGQASEGHRWRSALEEMERVVFVPSAHLGPYVRTFRSSTTLWVFFGARIPEGVRFDSPDLSRAEILVRLGALADDDRLRILRLVSEEGELRSQDIIETLDLSRSAASRHLRQLSATGYIAVRRCNGAKCYKLNPERIRDTLQAISTFLHVELPIG